MNTMRQKEIEVFLLKRFNLATNRVRKQAIKLYGAEAAYDIETRTLAHYKKIIPQIPDIDTPHKVGSNLFSLSLRGGAIYMALYFAQKDRGASLEKAGETIWALTELYIDSFSQILLRLNGILNRYKFRTQGNVLSKKMEKDFTLGAWTFDFKNDPKNQKNYHLNFTKCGICHLAKILKVEEMIPYCCRLDYLMANRMNSVFKRTGTLAEGFSSCDCSYEGKGFTPWPVPMNIES